MRQDAKCHTHQGGWSVGSWQTHIRALAQQLDLLLSLPAPLPAPFHPAASWYFLRWHRALAAAGNRVPAESFEADGTPQDAGLIKREHMVEFKIHSAVGSTWPSLWSLTLRKSPHQRCVNASVCLLTHTKGSPDSALGLRSCQLEASRSCWDGYWMMCLCSNCFWQPKGLWGCVAIRIQLSGSNDT